MSSLFKLSQRSSRGSLLRFRKICISVFLGALLAPLLASCGSASLNASAKAPIAVTAWPGTDPVLVFGSPSEGPRFLNILRSAGYVGYMGSTSDLKTYRNLVVLNDAFLDAAQISEIKGWVKNGGRVVLLSPIADSAFKLQLSSAGVAISSVDDPNLKGPVNFQGTLSAFLSKGGLTALATATSSSGSRPIVVSDTYGTGRILATSFDPFADSRNGYEVLPSLGRMVGTFLDAPRGPQTLQTTVYLDPGVLPANLKFNYAQIASDLVGVRSVELAAWDFGFITPGANYPYQSLIDALHNRGILVYAWLEPPFVNDFTWQQYPNCREVNEAGKAAIGDWRELIALEDPACFDIAWSQFATVLSSYKWDGVNFAEMYFESLADPKTATPYSPTALAQFGGDPLLNESGFIAFREKLVARIDGELLSKVNTLPNGASLDKELTIIDDTLDPTEATNIGSNMTMLAQVANSNGAELQVEDPYTVWSKGPGRYVTVNTKVSHLVSSANYSIDINDINRGNLAKPTAYPTLGELNLAALEAGRVNSKVDFYALGTIGTYDLSNLSYAVAGSVGETPSGVISNFPVKVAAPSTYQRLKVDGASWPTANGIAVIPAGTHSLVWSKGPSLSPGLLSIDANLGDARVLSPTKIFFDYYSRSVAYALLSEPPKTLTASAAAIAVTSSPDPNGGYWVKLPAGRVSIVATF